VAPGCIWFTSQRRPVTVYRLVTQGTIEEAILGLLGRKRALVTGRTALNRLRRFLERG